MCIPPVWGDLRLRVDSFSQTPAGNRAPRENRSKESSKEVENNFFVKAK